MKISEDVLLHLHRHLRELFPGVPDDVSQFEDGTQRVVSPVAALQVGVGHPRQDVPPAVRQAKQLKQSGILLNPSHGHGVVFNPVTGELKQLRASAETKYQLIKPV